MEVMEHVNGNAEVAHGAGPQVSSTVTGEGGKGRCGKGKWDRTLLPALPCPNAIDPLEKIESSKLHPSGTIGGVSFYRSTY